MMSPHRLADRAAKASDRKAGLQGRCQAKSQIFELDFGGGTGHYLNSQGAPTGGLLDLIRNHRDRLRRTQAVSRSTSTSPGA